MHCCSPQHAGNSCQVFTKVKHLYSHFDLLVTPPFFFSPAQFLSAFVFRFLVHCQVVDGIMGVSGVLQLSHWKERGLMGWRTKLHTTAHITSFSPLKPSPASWTSRIPWTDDEVRMEIKPLTITCHRLSHAISKCCNAIVQTACRDVDLLIRNYRRALFVLKSAVTYDKPSLRMLCEAHA